MNNCGNCKHRQNGICKNTDSDRYDKATPSEYYCDEWAGEEKIALFSTTFSQC